MPNEWIPMWDANASLSQLYLETGKQSKTQQEGVSVCNCNPYHSLQTINASFVQKEKYMKMHLQRGAQWPDSETEINTPICALTLCCYCFPLSASY